MDVLTSLEEDWLSMCSVVASFLPVWVFLKKIFCAAFAKTLIVWTLDPNDLKGVKWPKTRSSLNAWFLPRDQILVKKEPNLVDRLLSDYIVVKRKCHLRYKECHRTDPDLADLLMLDVIGDHERIKRKRNDIS